MQGGSSYGAGFDVALTTGPMGIASRGKEERGCAVRARQRVTGIWCNAHTWRGWSLDKTWAVTYSDISSSHHCVVGACYCVCTAHSTTSTRIPKHTNNSTVTLLTG